MKFPKRPKQHVSESNSFRLFSSKMPEHWIIREVTERDYGVDCYLEIVENNGDLTGHLVLCQLKSRESIAWSKANEYTLSQIDISTTNYWYNFQIPVFIFLTDIKEQELYFMSVNHYVRKNFDKYAKQNAFDYKMQKSLRFIEFDFKFFYYYEFYRAQFENEIVFFISNLHHYQEFMENHCNRDSHLSLDEKESIFLESMYRNQRYLCQYLNIDWNIPSLNELKTKSKQRFQSNIIDFYELDAKELITLIHPITTLIIKRFKSFAFSELNFWLYNNRTLYNYLNNIGPNGELPNYTEYTFS